MRTFYTITPVARVFIMLVAFLFLSEGAKAQTALFSEDFENTSENELPTGWTNDGSGTWKVGTGDAYTSTGAGQGSKNVKITHVTKGNVTKLITPEIDLTSVATASLSFMHIQRLWSPDQDELRIYYRTSSTGEWTLLKEYTSNIGSWTAEDILLPNLSATYQIAFEMTDGYGYGVGIDDVKISVPGPLDLTCTLTPGNGTVATLSWTEPGSATSWQICLNNDESNLIDATTNPFTLTNLTPETHYTAKVRSVGTGSNSPWSKAISFKPTNLYLFTVNDGTTTNKFVPVYGYYADKTQQSEFIIPATSLESIEGSTIDAMTFYADYDFSSTSSFQVYLKEVNETTFSGTDFYTAEGATTVYTGTLTVSATDGMTISFDEGYEYEGGNLLIGFYEATGGKYSSSDNNAFYGVEASGASISFFNGNDPKQRNFLPKVTFAYTPGGYRKPADLTISELTSKTATLTWTAPTGDGISGYAWQYKEASSNQWGTETTTTGTTATLSQLKGNTTYDFRVRTVYDDGESKYVTTTFTTTCAIPFTCDFENITNGELPAGWTTDGPGTWEVGTGDWETKTGAGEGNKNALIKTLNNGKRSVTKLITPPMDLSSGDAASLSFMHIQRLWNPDQDELRVYYRTSPTGEWTKLLEFTGNISSWTTEEGIALPNPSASYQIAFEMTDGGGYGVGIDKVEVAKTSMPKPTGLTYTLTPGNGTVATLSWTEKGSATAWQICLNDDETNLIEATSNSYDLTGLTPETTYTAKVRSVGTDDNSPWSDPVSFTPTNLYQLTVNDGTSTNTYMPVNGCRGDYKQRSEFIIPATSLTAIPTGRIINAMKFYANYNQDFTSTGSFQVYLREVDKTAFSSTDFYTAVGATTVYTGTLTVSATDGMTISMDDGYEYEGGNLLIGFYKEAAGGNKSSSQSDAFYGVTSDGASISMWSSYTVTQKNFLPKVTFSFLPGEHRKPRNLAISELTSSTATLTWEAPAGEKMPTGYAWQYKEASSNQWEIGATTNGTTATLTQLKGNTAYDFRLKAVYEDGERSVYVTTSFTTDCGQYQLPYTCDFENIDDKRCWSMVNCTENHSVWVFYQTNPYAKSGNHCFMFSSLDPTNGPQYLISPELSGTDNGVHVEFYYRSLMDGISYEEKFKVGYSTTDNALQSFTWDNEISCTSSDYMRFSASYPAGTKYVAVQYVNTDSYYLFIDDIKFEQTAPRKEPINVVATKSTTTPTTSVTVNWTPGSDETKWDIYASDNVNNIPVSETTPTVANVTTNPYTLTSLSPGTTYYIYVRAVNGDNRSFWSTPAMVDTKAEPMALPYSYGFEDKRLPCSWNVITTIPKYRTALNDNEKEDYAHSGDGYLRFRRRMKANTLESDGSLIAVLPEVSEAYPLSGCQLKFWAKKTESNTTPKFAVGIMTDPDDPTTFVQQGVTITPTDTYKKYTVRFNEYTGTGHYIAIKQTNYGEACIDDIVAEGIPSCWPIEDLTVADISGRAAHLRWTGYSDAYNISYRTAETDEQEAGEWQMVSTSEDAVKLTGLNPLTKYEVKVRGNCGSSVSEWSDPVTFTTGEACMDAELAISDVGISTATVSWTGTSDSYDVKYRTSAYTEGLSESFDKSDAAQRWLQYTIGAVDKVLAGTAELSNGGWGSWGISSNALGAYNMALNILDVNTTWLTTPEIILGNSPQMSFDVALTANGSEASANIGEATADDRFVVLIYADNKWTKLREWNNKSGSQYVFDNIATAGEHVTIDISAYASKTVKIAFYGESTEGYSDNDLHIDNVFVGQQQSAGEWQTATPTETTAQLTGLTRATKYDVKVVSACGDESEATFTTKDCADIVFAKEGYATYYNGQRDMVVPEGMTAYIVTDSHSEGKLSYYPIAGGNSNDNIVTAGTAVLLQVEPTDEPQTITVQLNAELSGESPAESMLHGSDTETITTGSSGDLFYKLTYNAQGTTIGWYWGEEKGAAFTSGAHKAWLAMPLPPETGNARSFIDLPGFNEASSVTSIQRSADNDNDDWYTIGGIKLQSRPTKKGIYLNNGRKVVIK